MKEKQWEELFLKLKKTLNSYQNNLPSISQIAIETNNNPFQILISTIISLRTKDKITKEASDRLFSLAKDPLKMTNLFENQIEKAIFPCNFYKRKAKNIKKISSILIEKYNCQVPNTQKELLQLPGVGIKTANLTLNLAFNIEAICVDCHVHQIANRLGWVKTKNPEETEIELKKIMPKKFWIPLNELLVSYGQLVCQTKKPKCNLCSLNKQCMKIGVKQFK